LIGTAYAKTIEVIQFISPVGSYLLANIPPYQSVNMSSRGYLTHTANNVRLSMRKNIIGFVCNDESVISNHSEAEERTNEQK
jgi:hypothetical protein